MDGSVGLTISLMAGYAVFLKFAKLWEMGRPQATGPQGHRS
jgi:hypothetical protein